jgi:hypothetical protein
MATISIFNQYGALNSKSVFEAFAIGAKKLGHTVTYHDFSADYYVIWSVLWHGRMRSNLEVWNQAKKIGKKIIVLEVGCIDRGRTWRVGLDHVNNLGFFGDSQDLIPNRSKQLGIKLLAWTMNGKYILICGQHTKSEQWKKFPNPEIWLRNTISEVKQYTDMPIVVRPHPRDWHWAANFSYKDVKINLPKKISGTYDDFNFDQDLKNAWAVINPSSNTGILSIINGVPAFVDSTSLAAPVGNLDLSTVVNPIRPRRDEWLEKFCHTEWTTEEIAQGLPILRLKI